MKKKPFFTPSQKIYIKDKTPMNHWVGNSLIKPIDDDELLNIRLITSELKSILNEYDAIDA